MSKKDCSSNGFYFKDCKNKDVLITKEMCEVFIEIYSNHKELLFQKRIYEYYKYGGWLFSRCKLYKQFKKKREYIENAYEVAKELKDILEYSVATDAQEKDGYYKNVKILIEENDDKIIIRYGNTKYIWDISILENNYQSDFLKIPSRKAILNIKNSHKDTKFIFWQMIRLIKRDILAYNYITNCRDLLFNRINVENAKSLLSPDDEYYTELRTFLNIMIKNSLDPRFNTNFLCKFFIYSVE